MPTPPRGSVPGQPQPDRVVNAGVTPDASTVLPPQARVNLKARLLQAIGAERNPGQTSARRQAIEQALERVPADVLPDDQRAEVAAVIDVYTTGNPNGLGLKDVVRAY